MLALEQRGLACRVMGGSLLLGLQKRSCGSCVKGPHGAAFNVCTCPAPRSPLRQHVLVALMGQPVQLRGVPAAVQERLGTAVPPRSAWHGPWGALSSGFRWRTQNSRH